MPGQAMGDCHRHHTECLIMSEKLEYTLFIPIYLKFMVNQSKGIKIRRVVSLGVGRKCLLGMGIRELFREINVLYIFI